ncbi:MAG TPA: hypothetical protein VFQ35_10535 [Polyangiaceae bacterium]|nr:hypothetical protein [Polyangiaceae bacterium]
MLLKGCAGLREREVERILATELAVDASHSESVHEPTWVIVTCEESKVVVEVHDPLSRKIVQRRFDFGTAKAKAQSRLVALAAAELVLASWAELAVLPEPRVAPEGGAASPEQRRLVRDRVVGPRTRTVMLGTDPSVARESRGPKGERIVYGDYVWERLPGKTISRVIALGSIRKFPTHDGQLFGGGARFGTDLLPLHSWAIDALVESGTLGGVKVDSFSAGAMLYFVGESGRHMLARAGAGLRAGVLRGSGEKSSGVVFPAFWGWPMLALAIDARFESLMVEISSEAGYATLPSRPGSGESSSGVWISAQVGLGLAL